MTTMLSPPLMHFGSEPDPFSNGSPSEDPLAFGALLLQIVAEVAKESSTAQVAARIADVFVQRLGARTARVYESGRENTPLQLRALSSAGRAPAVDFAKPQAADVLAERAVRSGLLHLTHATGGNDGRGESGPTSVDFPLFAGTVTVGAVWAAFDRSPEGHCPELRTLSYSLGASFGRARLQEENVRFTVDARRHRDGVAIIAHDLRQPLSKMLLSTSLLAKHLDPQHGPLLSHLFRSLLLFERMVSDMNEASLVASGKFTLHNTPVDAGELVRGAVAVYAPGAEVYIESDLPRVVADAQRIEQVLLNLLGNAARHGSRAHGLRVEVGLREPHIVISVTNQGEPIAEDDRRRVFDPYYRAGGREPMTVGLGLGLFICRKIVEQHGGEIWTDDNAGATRFSFSLPRATPSPDASQVRVALRKDYVSM